MVNLSSNKKIITNSFVLYIRMFFIMVLTFYTVRVVMNALGVIDYGIYNAVGGIVLIMSFISHTVTSAAQRFFSFEMGKNSSLYRRQCLFSNILLIFIFISLAIVLLSETIGQWFLFNKMVIPDERLNASFWVFQFSLFTFIITLISTPYRAIIIAYEEMNIFAYISVFESILKLVVAYSLLFSLISDRLIAYAFLMFVVSLIVSFAYILICITKYQEVRFTFVRNITTIKQIFNYTSWTMFGTIANAGNDQGTALLLNMFFGPSANAAHSIARQIGNAINTFAINIITAIRPPLIKSYADGNIEYMMNLFTQSSRYCFFCLYLIILPLLTVLDFAIYKWLGHVGEYMVIFSDLIIIYIMILSLSSPITIIAQAANEVKLYHGIVDGFTIFSIPISYILYKNDFAAPTIFVVINIVFVLAHCLRLWVFKKIIKMFSIKKYICEILCPICLILLISIPCVIGLSQTFSGFTWSDSIMKVLLSFVLCGISIFTIGLTKKERYFLVNFIKRYL